METATTRTGFVRSALIFCLMSVLICMPAATRPDESGQIRVGNFSAADINEKIPPGWQPLSFPSIERQTEYRLVRVDDVIAVKATSFNSASGLIRKIEIDPKKHPILSWKWRIANIIEKGDAFEKSGDDFPARLYVTFKHDPEKLSGWEKLKYRAARLLYGEDPPLHALTYVWANSAEPGSIIPNAHSARAVMIVVQSGDDRIDQWVDETRDIYEDYRQVFGEDPPLLSGVAMMTDSDNTGEFAVAYYGDIVMATPGTP